MLLSEYGLDSRLKLIDESVLTDSIGSNHRWSDMSSVSELKTVKHL